MEKGKVIAVAGHAGAGKNTILQKLIELNDFVYVPSFTTREVRKGEIPGKSYNFVSKQEFKKLIEEGHLLEWEMIHENYYGTAKKAYEDELNKGSIIISDLGVEGSIYLKSEFGEDVFTVFVKVDNEDELTKRLEKRGESLVEIQKRMKRIEYEKKLSRKFDFILDNEGSIDTAVNLLNEELIKRNFVYFSN